MRNVFLAVLLVLGSVGLGPAEDKNPIDRLLADGGRKAAVKASENKKFRFDNPSGRGSFRLVDPEKNLALDVSGTKLANDTLTGKVTAAGRVKVTGELKTKDARAEVDVELPLRAVATVEAKLVKRGPDIFLRAVVKSLDIRVDTT